MAITANQVIYYLKKAFKFYKKFQKSQQNKQKPQQQHHQQQQQYSSGNPYPPAVGQSGSTYAHPPQQSYQPPSSHYGGGGAGGYVAPQHGYGAHQGPATNQDMLNAQDSHYVELRNKAIREGDLMAKAFAASKQAYSGGDGSAAHDLSIQGKEHQRLKDEFNHEAASWIFNANNSRQPQGTIDLHGLYVQESIQFTENAIRESRNQGRSELRVIVGKGNHSPAHVAKLKPAIVDLMQKERLTAVLDPHNAGVLVVQLQGQGGKASREILGDLERDPNNDCIVM